MPSTVPYSYFPVGTAVVVRSGFLGFAVTIHRGARGWRFSAALISHTLAVSKRLFFFPPCDHVRIRFPSNQLSNLNRPRGIWFQMGAPLSLSNPRYWCQWFSNIGLLLLMMFVSAFPSAYFKSVRFLSRYNSPQCDVVCVPVINYPRRMAVEIDRHAKLPINTFSWHGGSRHLIWGTGPRQRCWGKYDLRCQKCDNPFLLLTLYCCCVCFFRGGGRGCFPASSLIGNMVHTYNQAFVFYCLLPFSRSCLTPNTIDFPDSSLLVCLL